MPIKAIIFDADGVVIFPWRFGNRLEIQYGITREMTAPFFTSVFQDCLVGSADLESVLSPYLKQWGWTSTVEEFISIWLEEENAVDERIVETIHLLKHTGLICCLATSQEANRAAYMRTEMGFNDLFDRLFFSCELGCQKPDPAFFQAVTQALGLEGEHILFWDDSPSNVAGARACGWQALVYKDFKDFIEITNRLV